MKMEKILIYFYLSKITLNEMVNKILNIFDKIILEEVERRKNIEHNSY